MGIRRLGEAVAGRSVSGFGRLATEAGWRGAVVFEPVFAGSPAVLHLPTLLEQRTEPGLVGVHLITKEIH